MTVEQDVKRLNAKVAELAQQISDLASAVRSVSDKTGNSRESQLAEKVRVAANRTRSQS